MFTRRPAEEVRRSLEARMAALEQQVAARLEAEERATRELVDKRLGELAFRAAQGPEEQAQLLLASVSGPLRARIEAVIDQAQRLEDLTAKVERQQKEATEALEGLNARLAGEAPPSPRERAALGTVHRAEVLGYVSLYFEGGQTDKVELLVGSDDPPTEVVCALNTVNDLNSYAGGVVRPGEHWMARSSRGARSGVACVFTPLL